MLVIDWGYLRFPQELEHKLDIEKRKQRERVKVINQQQIAMKEAARGRNNEGLGLCRLKSVGLAMG